MNIYNYIEMRTYPNYVRIHKDMCEYMYIIMYKPEPLESETLTKPSKTKTRKSQTQELRPRPPPPAGEGGLCYSGGPGNLAAPELS